MKLIERPNIGDGIHRSGWPVVMDALREVANGRGLVLDDCVEYSFLFGPTRPPHKEPWVGIFHFPHDVNSPIRRDVEKNSAFTLLRNPTFLKSLATMQSGIALTKHLADWLSRQLGKPFAALRHPTDTSVALWNPARFAATPTMFQVGWHLRNTRAIYHQEPLPGWSYHRIAMYQPYQRERDAAIRKALGSERNPRDLDRPRLSNEDYDAMMASSLVLSHAFGAAACNVVVECIARCTPLLSNRCSGNVEYLGEDYPLYLEDRPNLTVESVHAASKAIAHARSDWLEPAGFAYKVAELCR